MVVVGLAAPAAAFAQSAAGEYDNVHLPNAGGKYDLPTGTGGAGVSQASNAGTGGDGGGGGTTLLLVGLLVVAAGCAGVAAWRLRGDANRKGGSPPTAPVSPDSPGESGPA